MRKNLGSADTGGMAMRAGRAIRDAARAAEMNPYGNVSQRRIQELREERDGYAAWQPQDKGSRRNRDGAIKKLDKMISELETEFARQHPQ